MKVCVQVGSVGAAREAQQAGVDFVIAQGAEAGGHTHGSLSTLALVPQVVDAVLPVPVVAGGGVADSRGFVAALALGAEGVVLGTRFLASARSLCASALQSAGVAGERGGYRAHYVVWRRAGPMRPIACC